MIKKINSYGDGNTLIEEYSFNGSTISHRVKKSNSVYYLLLKGDKTEIFSDGIDKAVITATVYNYENIFQSAFSGDIIFEVEGVMQTVKAVNGKASTSISSTTPGEIKIKASTPGFRDGEVLVNAV